MKTHSTKPLLLEKQRHHGGETPHPHFPKRFVDTFRHVPDAKKPITHWLLGGLS